MAIEEMLTRLCITMETLVAHLHAEAQNRERDSNRREREYESVRDILQNLSKTIEVDRLAKPKDQDLKISINGLSLSKIWTYAKWLVFPALGASAHILMKLLEHH